MKPETEKVLQRLSFEKLLVSTGVVPQRKRITLADVLTAGKEEPRALMVLPAIFLCKKSIIYRFDLDLKKNPSLRDSLQKIFIEKKKGNRHFFGMDIAECERLAQHFKTYLDHKRSKQRSLMRSFRFSQDDISRLKTLTQQMKTGGLSETIRKLVHEKLVNIGM